MTNTLPPDSQLLLENMANSQLTKVLFGPTGQWLHLEFTSTLNERDMTLQLFNLIHFVYSRILDNDEGPFFVGQITLNTIVNGGEQILSSLNYPFSEKNGGILSYPSKPLFHFRLEGGVCIEVICSTYKILQEIT